MPNDDEMFESINGPIDCDICHNCQEEDCPSVDKKEEDLVAKKEKAKKIVEEAIAIRNSLPKPEKDPNRRDQLLLNNLKANLPKLEKLLEKVNGHWNYEDVIYRFYHGSFKVYWVQGLTKEIIDTLKKIAPEGTTFNSEFYCIYNEGTGLKFEIEHNDDWLKYTRPQIEAFLHAKFFLEMAIKYAKELENAPDCLPSGWAALLYFYGMRYG